MPKLSKNSLTFLKKMYNDNINIYYNSLDKDKIDEIIKIINGDYEISLRLLDWFVTKYTKTNNTVIFCNKINSEINVYIAYKSQLKIYTKKFFDPFKRQPIIEYTLNNIQLKTTIGQLLFLKWLYSYNIIDFIKNNIDSLYHKMYIYCINEQKKKLKNSKKRNSKE
jgi:hypothetical protein